MEDLKKRIGLDYDRLSRMSIVEEGAVKVFKILIVNFDSIIYCMLHTCIYL